MFPLYTLDTSFTPAQEKDVLLDIYSSTNGKQWYQTSGWNSSNNNTSHCTWYGITCHNDTSYVKAIVLAYNNLEGSLPNNIWKIRNLFSLCVPGNPRLRGHIGDFLFGNMTKLITVHFSASSISGDIPQEIVKMSNLQNFLGCIMKGNGLTGHLPEDIGNMTELRVLCLGGNKLTGQIPRSISKLRNLWYLDFRITPGMVHGNLSDILSIPSLTDLFISGVHLTGKMPHMMPQQLRYLVLPGNNISGEFTKIFPKHNSLEILNVANNQLTGDIPGELLLQNNTNMIDLSQNQFSSINNGQPWPENVTAPIRWYVSFAGNRNLSINFKSFLELFSGRRVDFTGRSPSIVNLSFCDIKSPVLANILYLEKMSTCDLKGNKLYGSVPDFYEDFSFLTYFDLSSNNLTGTLPAGIQNLISLQYFDISGNPFMRDENDATSNAYQPDFSKMARPPEADNFTCPEGRLTFNNGLIRLDPTFYEYKYCICDTGFYGDKGLCKQCMKDGTCQRWAPSLVEDLRPSIMNISSGYWPSPDPANATHLVKCPVKSACNPSGLCSCRLVTSPKDTRAPFKRPAVSSLTTTCDISCICHLGNTDRFCSRCKYGFYKLSGLCFQCRNGDSFYYYLFIPMFAASFLVLIWSYFYYNVRPAKWFAVTAVHFLLMLIMMLLEFLPAWFFKLNLVVFVLCMTSRGKAARSLISIAVFYIQTMDFMVSSVNVWPKKVIAAQSYLSSYWNLYFPALSCDLPSIFTPVGKFVFLLLLPVVCLSTVGAYFIIMLTMQRFCPNTRRMEQVHFKCRQTAFFCLSFSYFPIVKQTLSIVRPCHKDLNVLYMPSSPWIECTSDTYLKLTTLGIVSIVVYVIGFPLMVISLMLLFFPKRSSMSPEDRKKLDVWLGPIYLPYKPKYQAFFEVVMLLRRLILAIALSMIPSSSTLQTFVVWLVLMVSAIIHLILRPYDTQPGRREGEIDCQHERLKLKGIFSENVFEPLVLFVLSMSFMVLRFSTLDVNDTNFFVWFVMVVNTCVLIGLLGGILYRLAGKITVPGNTNENGEQDDRFEEEANSCNEERSHLLRSGSRCRYLSINNDP